MKRAELENKLKMIDALDWFPEALEVRSKVAFAAERTVNAFGSNPLSMLNF